MLKIQEFSHRRCHACAQSLPDSQQVDLQAWVRWKEDTCMHGVELSDRQEFTGAGRNPDRKTALKRTKNTPVASARGAISHKPKLVDQLVASQEDSAHKRDNVGGKVPKFSAQPYFVGLFLCAW